MVTCKSTYITILNSTQPSWKNPCQRRTAPTRRAYTYMPTLQAYPCMPTPHNTCKNLPPSLQSKSLSLSLYSGPTILPTSTQLAINARTFFCSYVYYNCSFVSFLYYYNSFLVYIWVSNPSKSFSDITPDQATSTFSVLGISRNGPTQGCATSSFTLRRGFDLFGTFQTFL